MTTPTPPLLNDYALRQINERIYDSTDDLASLKVVRQTYEAAITELRTELAQVELSATVLAAENEQLHATIHQLRQRRGK